jgi:uncharacterized protein (DUF305 family)
MRPIHLQPFALAGALAALLATTAPYAAPAGATPSLPEICLPDVHDHHDHGDAMGDMPVDDHAAMQSSAAPAGAADAAHSALMAGMDAMHEDMALGMAAENIDVAFICGMLPHHGGALDMARAELTYGTDPFARDLAARIIESQQAEIDAMLDWLSARAR